MLAPLALALLLGARPASPPSLATLADAVAGQLRPPSEGRRALGLRLEVEEAALAPPLAAALATALARAGWATAPLPAGADEGAARDAGCDWVLRLRVAAAPGARELVAVGEATPLWRSFFLQARPGVPPAPARLVSARAPADAEALLLLRPARGPDASRLVVRRLARLPGPVLAVAVGEVDRPTAPALVVVTDEAVLLLDARGALLASGPLAPTRQPVRQPWATAVVGDLGGGRIGVAVAGAVGGEVLARDGARLRRVAALQAVPLASGEAGTLFGAFVPGRAALADLLTMGVDPEARPASARELAAVVAAPRGGPVAFASVDTEGRLLLLGPHLEPRGTIDGVGAGVALADLDGDGVAEVVASLATPTPPDRIRVLRIAGGVPIFESAPVEGLVLAGAAGDLTGDGVDDALLAVRVVGDDGAVATDLLLVTADPREAP